MRLTVFNGSPRVKESNTALLLDHLLAGFTAAGGEVAGVHYLAQSARRAGQVEAFAAAENVLLAFPLYVDAMPATVKEFVEALAPLAGRGGNPRLLFLVQSGFPEACHCRPVEAWLEKFARRMGSPSLGTLVRGGAEGIRSLPAVANRSLFATLRALGEGLARTGAVDPRLAAELARRERYTGPVQTLTAAVTKRLGVAYWNHRLRRHGAYERRFAAPYGAPYDPERG